MDLLAWLESFALNYGFFGVFLFSVIAHATLFLPLPSYLIVYGLGSHMNPFLLGVFAGTGAALGELTSYFVGYGLKKGVHLEQKKGYPGVQKFFRKYGFWAIPFFAATPMPTDAIGIVAGVLRYPLSRFFLGCFIGKVILHWIMAYGGYYSFTIVKNVFGKEGSVFCLALFLAVLTIFFIVWLKYKERFKLSIESLP